jgi:hypothetical protein
MADTHEVFCDIHLQPMELVTLAFVIPPVDRWQSTFFRCSEPACRRHFNPTHGYVDIRDSIDGSTRKIRGCPNRAEHLGSVAIVALDGTEPVWNCIYKDCEPEEASPFVGSVIALG